jgi:hypothetical protein
LPFFAPWTHFRAWGKGRKMRGEGRGRHLKHLVGRGQHLKPNLFAGTCRACGTLWGKRRVLRFAGWAAAAASEDTGVGQVCSDGEHQAARRRRGLPSHGRHLAISFAAGEKMPTSQETLLSLHTPSLRNWVQGLGGGKEGERGRNFLVDGFLVFEH